MLTASLSTTTKRGSALVFVIVAFSAMFIGCKPPSFYATSAGNPSTLGSMDVATIVIMRPGRYGRANVTNVYDRSGTIVAQFKGQMWAAIHVSPGPVALYHGRHGPGASEPNMIRGEVQAGRVYFLYAGLSTWHSRFEVMRPGHEQWGARWELLAKQEQAVLEPEVNAWVAENPERGRELIEEANREWPELTETQREARTIMERDGESNPR